LGVSHGVLRKPFRNFWGSVAMGVTPSSLNLRRLTHYFLGRSPSDGLSSKWNAAECDAFFERPVNALSIKTASQRSMRPAARRRFIHGCLSGLKARGNAEVELGTQLMLGEYDDDSMQEEEEQSDTPIDHTSTDPPSYEQLRQEVEALRKEKRSLTRALAESEMASMQCTAVLEKSNDQLQATMKLVTELSGVVKYLNQHDQKQAEVNAKLRMDNSMLSKRLEKAFAEIYRLTGNQTLTMKERMLMTPRSVNSFK